MPDKVIADTSSLIILDNIQELVLLKKVYQEVLITPEVVKEFGKTLPDWFQVISAQDSKYQQFIQLHIDVGEASVIALAMENQKSLVILDDLKARKLGKKLGLKITGTLGVLHKAKEIGVISKVKPILEKIMDTDFRLSPAVLKEFLKLNNE